MEDTNYIGAEELVFNTDKENGIYSGGFDVKSIMMKAGMSPIMTLNDQTGGGVMNKVSDLFESLVIPNWALSYNSRIIGGNKDIKDNYDNSDDENNYEIEDELHDKLLDLVREHDMKTDKEKTDKEKTDKEKTDKEKTDKEKKGGKRTRKSVKTKKSITKKKK